MAEKVLSSIDKVVLRPSVTIIEDGDGQYCLGDPEAGEFVSLPEPGAFLVSLFRSALTVAEIRDRFRDRYGEDPDLEHFVAALTEVGLVASIGTEVQPPPPQRSRGITLLGGLQARHCAWLISAPARVVAWAAWLLLPVALAVHLPRAADALVYPSVLTLLLVFVPVAWVLMALHELAHSLVARANGCAAYTRFGNRLWNLVCETDLSAVYSLPRRRRYGALLAGMTFDVLVLDVSVLLIAAQPQWRPSYVIAYMMAANLIYQCSVYLRTDLYFVLTTALGLDNLLPNARAELRRAWLRASGRQQQSSVADGRQLVAIRIYALCCIAALALGIWSLVTLIIPTSYGVLRLGFTALAGGRMDGEFWAAAFTVTFFAFVYSTLGWTYLRNLRDRRRARSNVTM